MSALDSALSQYSATDIADAVAFIRGNARGNLPAVQSAIIAQKIAPLAATKLFELAFGTMPDQLAAMFGADYMIDRTGFNNGVDFAIYSGYSEGMIQNGDQTISNPQYANWWAYDVSAHAFVSGILTVKADDIFPGAAAIDFVRIGIDERTYMLWCVALVSGIGQSAHSHDSWSGYAGNNLLNIGQCQLGLFTFMQPAYALQNFYGFKTQFAALTGYEAKTGKIDQVFGVIVVVCIVAAALYSGGASLSLFGPAAEAPAGSLTVADVTQAATVFPVDMTTVAGTDLPLLDVSTVAPALASPAIDTVSGDYMGTALSSATAPASSAVSQIAQVASTVASSPAGSVASTLANLSPYVKAIPAVAALVTAVERGTYVAPKPAVSTASSGIPIDPTTGQPVTALNYSNIFSQLALPAAVLVGALLLK